MTTSDWFLKFHLSQKVVAETFSIQDESVTLGKRTIKATANRGRRLFRHQKSVKAKGVREFEPVCGYNFYSLSYVFILKVGTNIDYAL